MGIENSISQRRKASHLPPGVGTPEETSARLMREYNLWRREIRRGSVGIAAAVWVLGSAVVGLGIGLSRIGADVHQPSDNQAPLNRRALGGVLVGLGSLLTYVGDNQTVVLLVLVLYLYVYGATRYWYHKAKGAIGKSGKRKKRA